MTITVFISEFLSNMARRIVVSVPINIPFGLMGVSGSIPSAFWYLLYPTMANAPTLYDTDADGYIYPRKSPWPTKASSVSPSPPRPTAARTWATATA
jgi:hypothetical protein